MRAQIQNQVFIYIMAALLVGLTFYFGYKGIASISSTASTAALVEFKRTVPDAISAVAYGETREYNLKVPAGYEVCFINETPDYPDMTVDSFLQDAYTSTEKNLFLINKKTNAVTPIDTVPMSVENSMICLDASGKIILEKIGKIINVRL